MCVPWPSVCNQRKNKKPTCLRFGGGFGYALGLKAFLQSWLFTQTRHSGPCRHMTTTTGSSSRLGEAQHDNPIIPDYLKRFKLSLWLLWRLTAFIVTVL
jgi:hypothetical protein